MAKDIFLQRHPVEPIHFWKQFLSVFLCGIHTYIPNKTTTEVFQCYSEKNQTFATIYTLRDIHAYTQSNTYNWYQNPNVFIISFRFSHELPGLHETLTSSCTWHHSVTVLLIYRWLLLSKIKWSVLFSSTIQRPSRSLDVSIYYSSLILGNSSVNAEYIFYRYQSRVCLKCIQLMKYTFTINKTNILSIISFLVLNH